jgi:hypothetical protein
LYIERKITIEGVSEIYQWIWAKRGREGFDL